MSATALNQRRKEVLQAIVEAYIESALPISSQAIVHRLRPRLSSATIRNVMAELTELGFICQPHTSAGRIPTDEGYRYYIDSLVEVEELTPRERQLIDNGYNARNEIFDELLKEVLGILANFSGYTALAFSSGLRRILFKRLEFVSVESTKLLVVLMSQEGLVKTAVIQMPYRIETQDLWTIARFLNEEFTGLRLEEIKRRISLRILNTSDSFFHILKTAEHLVELTVESCDRDKLYLEGTRYIFEQPEFQNTQKLQNILRTFEQESPLLEIMRAALDREGIEVHIGKENLYEDIHECSLVISNFKMRKRNMGTLGIIGPRRMPYSKAIAVVGYMAHSLGLKMAD